MGQRESTVGMGDPIWFPGRPHRQRAQTLCYPMLPLHSACSAFRRDKGPGSLRTHSWQTGPKRRLATAEDGAGTRKMVKKPGRVPEETVSNRVTSNLSPRGWYWTQFLVPSLLRRPYTLQAPICGAKSNAPPQLTHSLLSDGL